MINEVNLLFTHLLDIFIFVLGNWLLICQLCLFCPFLFFLKLVVEKGSHQAAQINFYSKSSCLSFSSAANAVCVTKSGFVMYFYRFSLVNFQSVVCISAVTILQIVDIFSHFTDYFLIASFFLCIVKVVQLDLIDCVYFYCLSFYDTKYHKMLIPSRFSPGSLFLSLVG